MFEELVVLLAGRVAEETALDDICTGASNDIERATQTARDMVTRYGFSRTLGPVVYGQPEGEVFLGRDFGQQRNYSENVAKEIDEEIRELIDKAYEEARRILTEHRDQLDLIANYLMEYEKVNGEKFEKLMKGEMTFTPRSEEKNISEKPAEQLPSASDPDGEAGKENKNEETSPQDTPPDNAQK